MKRTWMEAYATKLTGDYYDLIIVQNLIGNFINTIKD